MTRRSYILLAASIELVLGTLCMFSAKPKAAVAPRTHSGAKPGKQMPLIGHVVYLQTLNGQKEGPADVVECDLATGRVKCLISHTAFSDADVYMSVLSPDGNYLLFEISTLLSRTHRVWSRKTGRLTEIRHGGFWEPMAWSYSGRYLLASDQDKTNSNLRTVSRYDALTGRSETLGRFSEVALAAWLPGDKAVVVVDAPSYDRPSKVYLQPVDGKRERLLLKWPRHIYSIGVSPDASAYAFSDAVGVYYADIHGKRVRNLHITEAYTPEITRVDFAYDGRSDKLAVLEHSSCGPGFASLTESLWLVDLGKRTRSELAEWQGDYRLIGQNESCTARQLEGWLPDHRSVLIYANTTTGSEDISTQRSDWNDLLLYDTTRPNSRGKVLFSRRSGCPDLKWWR